MRRIRWSFVAILTILVLGAVAGVLYLQSEGFRQTVESRLTSRIEEATGLACDIDDFQIDVMWGRFDLRGLRLDPRPGAAETFRLGVERIHGKFSWVTFWRPRITLAELVVTGPRLNLEFHEDRRTMDPDAVEDAIRRSLEFGARSVEIRGGYVELNNRRIPLDLTLRDLALEIRYHPAPSAYTIRLGYRKASVEWLDRVLSYDLDANLTLNAQGLNVEKFEVRRENSSLRGEGWLSNWRSPTLLLHAGGIVEAGELSVFDPHFEAVRGQIRLSGNFRWDAQGFRSNGRYELAPASYRGIHAEYLRGLFEMEGDSLSLSEVEGQLESGKFQAEASFHLKHADRASQRLHIAAQGMVLRHVAKILNLSGIEYENSVDAVCDLEWRQGLADLEIAGSATLHGFPEAVDEPQRLSLEGSAEFRYSRGIWYVPKATLRSAYTQVEASGHEGSRFHIKVSTTHLAEPLGIARSFSGGLRAILEEHPDMLDARGLYQLDGDVSSSSPTAVSYEGKIRIEGAKWRAFSAGSVTADVSWDGRRLEMRSLRILRGKETVDGSLSLTLRGGEGERPDFTFTGGVRDLSLDSLPELGLEIPGKPRGTLTGTGSASYDGGIWRGSGVLRVEKGNWFDEPFDLAVGRVNLSDRELELVECDASRGAAQVTVRGKVLLESNALNLVGSLRSMDLESIPSVRDRVPGLGGSLSASGLIRGTLENPVVTGDFNLARLRYDTWDLGGGKGKLEFRDKLLKGDATVESDLGFFNAGAQLSTSEGLRGKARLEFRDWNVRKIITADLPPYLEELSTALEGTLELEGDFAEPSSLRARGEMDGARFKINDYELSNSGMIQFGIDDQSVRIDECRLLGEGSDLSLAGSIPLRENGGLNLRLDGTLNLKVLQTKEVSVAVSGATQIDVRATGSLRNPQIIGRAVLNNSRFEHDNFPFPLSSVEGDLTFSTYSVRVENVRGRLASGTFQVSGSLEHQNAEIRSINLQLTSRGTRLPYPRDFHSTLDAELILRGGKESQILTGNINVVRTEYLREFSLLEQLASRATHSSGPLVTDPALAGLRLDIAIRSDDGLVIDNELLRLRGRINLNLRGTPAYPSLTGRVEATEGSIFFRGNRFDIVRASADFVDRNRINPVFDVRAEADVRSYRLILDINGDIDRMRSNIRSDPPMATVDIVTLLATGKAREESQDSRRQAEITGLSAASILSESLTGVIGKRVQRFFGLESFRVDPFLAGVENDPTARVTISERLSKELTITYSRNLSTDEEQIVVVEYDVNRGLSILATRDEDGKFAVDFRFRKRFR